MYTFHLLKQQIWARWDNDVSDENDLFWLFLVCTHDYCLTLQA
jgi:hypothetical protein